MSPIRIGCVQYLNTLPLIEGLRAWRDCELVTAVPSRLADMLRGGEVDVALVSVIDAAGGGGGEPGLVILPVGMIGCDGPTLTVRLFSAVPIERLTRVAVDTDSHTSVTLMRIVLKRKYGIDVEIVEFDAREHMLVRASPSASLRSAPPPPGEDLPDWPEAVLLIGDKVVTDPPPAEKYPHQLDLGAAWKEMTGLPFVYAVWMCRAGEENSTKVRTAAAMLDRARRRNQMRLGWIVARHAAERRWPADAAATYLGDYLRFEVGEPEREAIEKFLSWADESGERTRDDCNDPRERDAAAAS